MSTLLSDIIQTVSPANTGTLGPLDALNMKSGGDVLVAGGYGWRDLISEPYTRGGASAPALTQFRDGIYLYEFSATQNREVFASFHIDHDYQVGTPIYPHAHWTTLSTATSGTVIWKFEYSYAKGHNQGSSSAFPASTTVTVTHTVDASRQYRHMVSEVSTQDAIPGTDLETDGIILMRVYRDAANDTFADTVFLITVDCHYQMGQLSTPNKAPSFF